MTEPNKNCNPCNKKLTFPLCSILILFPFLFCLIVIKAPSFEFQSLNIPANVGSDWD